MLAWPEVKEDVRLEKGRMKENQLWLMDRAEVVDGANYFWIKPKKYDDLCLHASAVHDRIRVSGLDQSLRVCLWEFLPYTGNILKELSTLRSTYSRLVVDVPEHSTKEGVSLIQYLYQGCGNQRWTISKASSMTS